MDADNNDLASSFEQLLLTIDISSMPLIYIQQKNYIALPFAI
jgi:hypothetical protein